MRNNFIWILLLIWPLVLVTCRPAHTLSPGSPGGSAPPASAEQVISVRITSSVAVGRTQLRPRTDRLRRPHPTPPPLPPPSDFPNNDTDSAEDFLSFDQNDNETQSNEAELTTEMPFAEPSTEMITTTVLTETPILSGANIEFIKQLNARKGSRGHVKPEDNRYFGPAAESYYPNDTEDSAAEASLKSISGVVDIEEVENHENVPLARSVPYSASSNNHIQGFVHRRPFNEKRNSPKLTTVSFNVIHDTSIRPHIPYDDLNKPVDDTQSESHFSKPQTNLPQLSKIYNEPAKIYSQPAKVYSEPAKFYSEPAKIYSEPAKVYSEPAKVYSEPAKVYSEPAKFYSQPASLHLPPGVSSIPWQNETPRPSVVTATVREMTTTPLTRTDQLPERNYEVDENESVMTDGRSHGVQDDREKCRQENCKVGYVVEGRQYKKYQVEEKTPDGFIVGEYGVVRNEDGALRGVRYTADSDVSPRLIYDTLMKFLQLK